MHFRTVLGQAGKKVSCESLVDLAVLASEVIHGSIITSQFPFLTFPAPTGPMTARSCSDLTVKDTFCSVGESDTWERGEYRTVKILQTPGRGEYRTVKILESHSDTLQILKTKH